MTPRAWASSRSRRSSARDFVLGAVGKLWKEAFELLPLDRDEFVGFHDAKYVKLVRGFLVLPYGRERTLLKHESRMLATDDSARAHLRRSWRVVEPYVHFFMRRALETLKEIAKELRDEVTGPPWRSTW
jgi:hypothetical protein